MRLAVISIALLLTCFAMPVLASKYVSDVLWVSLRTEAADDSSNIRVLKSGVKLEVIDEVEVEGYLHVRTEQGEEGWIKSRYLVDKPIAALRVSQLEKELDKLKAENNSLKSTLSSEKKDSKESDLERKRILSENQQLKTELAKLQQVADKPIQLQQENEKLKSENQRLMVENEELSAKKSLFGDEAQRTWFMTGAGILFAGIILGLIFPNLRFRRRSGW